MNSPILVSHDTPAFVSFLAGVAKISTDYRNAHFPNLAKNYTTSFEVNSGARYLRVEKVETTTVTKEVTSRSAHLFVDRTNGDVLKTAGWKAPAKGARGNIFDAANGLARVGPYGTEYNNR